MWTETLSADDPHAVLWAVELLRDGEIVALPTEPVYGLESTIVAIRQNALHILRSGPVTREALAEFAPIVESAAPALPEAPGQLESHYAPRTPMHLLDAGMPAPPMRGKRVGVLAWQLI